MSLRGIDRYVRSMRDDLAAVQVPQDLKDRYGRYFSDPVGLVLVELGVPDTQESFPDYQRAVLRDVAANEQVAWVAGHACGKSHASAFLLIWYLLTRPHCKVIVTSATFERQVGRVVFGKVRALIAQAPEAIPLEVFNTRAHVTGFADWAAEGVPATRPGNFAGFHAGWMLTIADEAKSLCREVFTELHGNLASARDEARLLMLSTAGPADGYFFDAFERNSDHWVTHRTPSTESPFAKGYAERMLRECMGESDPIYQMRVLARFAEDVEGQLIPLSAIYAAVNREFDDPEPDEKAEVTLGVDVARFGEDRSVIAVRCGRRIRELVAWRGADTVQSAERVEAAVLQHKAVAFIDEIGIGAGTVDSARRRLGSGRVVGVNVARAADDDTMYANLRSALGWKLRGRFQAGDISIPDDPGLISELAALRYGYDQWGRIKLEPKDAAKARLGRSPDLADALMLAFTRDAQSDRRVIITTYRM